MKLVRLSSNKESFRTIEFNNSGISIIAAMRVSDDNKKTYNSVGKSFALYLVHFCFGANSTDDFEQKLTGWEFELEFTISDQPYSILRKVSESSTVIFNDKEIKIKDLKEKLADLIFTLPKDSKYLTFRSLISRFMRGSKGSYIEYNRFIDEEQKNPFSQLRNNSLVLGLDTNKVLVKGSLKEKLDKVKELKKNIENDNVLKSFFQSEDTDEFDLKVADLELKIRSLKDSLNSFEIAEDYNQIKLEADQISLELKDLRNKRTKIQNTINNISKSIQIEPDISRSRLLGFYKRAEFELGDLVKKKLLEIEKFNKKLLSNRQKRLLQDKEMFEERLKQISTEISKLGRLENQKLQYLDTHGALDEFSQLNKQLGEYNKQLEKIRSYQKLLEEYQNQVEDTEQEFVAQNKETREYLNKTREERIQRLSIFSELTKEFYSDKPSAIFVKNNEGINKTRYDIQAKLQDDAGDAVNEVKIFCFDWTILKNQMNHIVKFIFHDSRITDGMDTRQLATLFRIAHREKDYQYIISLNQDRLDNLKGELSEEDYDEIIEDNIVLRLSDESDQNKLLGVQIDLNYEKG